MNDRSRVRRGVALALVTAAVSGVAVYVNGYGVRAAGDATLYTVAKNLVAATILAGIAGVASRRSTYRPGDGNASGPPWKPAVLAVIGGSIPFVLFFEGLARADTVDAAFIHKTLVVWVAALAVPFLGERIGPRHVASIALLLLGLVALSGGRPTLGWGTGEALIAVATLLWSVEVIVAKRLLASVSSHQLAVWRMAGGSALLVAWLGATGRVAELLTLGAAAWLWALGTGVLLSLYVATWFAALARAPATDVTAVLVAGAGVTALLQSGFSGAPIDTTVPGVGILAAGLAVLLWRADRSPVPARGRPPWSPRSPAS